MQTISAKRQEIVGKEFSVILQALSVRWLHKIMICRQASGKQKNCRDLVFENLEI